MEWLEQNPEIRNSRGLYAGCGNGRNYVTLTHSGLDITGLDVSTVGLEQIVTKDPSLASKLVQGDMIDHAGMYGYIIAIQSFQHEDTTGVHEYFRKIASMLRAGGMLFVRVNAVSTDINHAHVITEQASGGFIILYKNGPKSGLRIHFFSKEELLSMVAASGLVVRHVTMVTANHTYEFTSSGILCTKEPVL